MAKHWVSLPDGRVGEFDGWFKLLEVARGHGDQFADLGHVTGGETNVSRPVNEIHAVVHLPGVGNTLARVQDVRGLPPFARHFMEGVPSAHGTARGLRALVQGLDEEALCDVLAEGLAGTPFAAAIQAVREELRAARVEARRHVERTAHAPKKGGARSPARGQALARAWEQAQAQGLPKKKG